MRSVRSVRCVRYVSAVVWDGGRGAEQDEDAEAPARPGKCRAQGGTDAQPDLGGERGEACAAGSLTHTIARECCPDCAQCAQSAVFGAGLAVRGSASSALGILLAYLYRFFYPVFYAICYVSIDTFTSGSWWSIGFGNCR